jgi:hypothetical protein
MRTVIISIFISLLLLPPHFVVAQEMRTINPIPTPAALPPGAEVVEAKPLDPGAVKGGIDQLTSKWNSATPGEMLSERFYDKSRFGDAMLTNVPRDARLKKNIGKI